MPPNVSFVTLGPGNGDIYIQASRVVVKAAWVLTW